MALDRSRKRASRQALSTTAAVGGVAIGGPFGILAAEAVEFVGGELLTRALGSEERRRIAGMCQAVNERLEQRLVQGEVLRDDEFFSAPPELGTKLAAPWGVARPPAHEVLEAVMAFAGRTYEERKLPHLKELVVSLMFDCESAPAYANYLVRLANELSYRQLLLIAIFNGDTYQPGLAEGDVRPDSPSAIGMELEDLARRGLIGMDEPQGDAYPTRSVLEVGLRFIKNTYDGRKLHDLMRLDTLAEGDVANLAEELGRSVGR